MNTLHNGMVFNRWGFSMRVLVFLVGVLGLFTQAAAQNIPQICSQQHCMAVVDAGSTGSRLHIYAYGSGSNPSITELWSKKVNPGVASLEAKKDRVDAYLNDLFPDLGTQKIPVYFYATAGMRLLPQPKQQKIYTLIQGWFANRADWTLIQSQTIAGSDEGLYAWLAVNYQTGGLKDGGEPVGVMDFGGASVQVAFPVKDARDIEPSNLKEVEVNGKRVNLFVHSFLGLGQVEMSHQFLNAPACFSVEYELPDGFPAQGDAYACAANIATLVKSVHQVNDIVQPSMASSSAKNWYALGGVAALAQGKIFSFNNLQFTNTQLLEKANSQVCQQSWSSLLASWPDDDFLYGDCLFPAYYYAVFVDGYGLNPDQSIHYFPSEQEADWTIGVVLAHQKASV